LVGAFFETLAAPGFSPPLLVRDDDDGVAGDFAEVVVVEANTLFIPAANKLHVHDESFIRKAKAGRGDSKTSRLIFREAAN